MSGGVDPNVQNRGNVEGIQQSNYEVRQEGSVGKLYIDGKPHTVRIGGKEINNPDQLEKLAKTFRKTLAEPLKLKEGEVARVTSKGVKIKGGGEKRKIDLISGSERTFTKRMDKFIAANTAKKADAVAQDVVGERGEGGEEPQEVPLPQRPESRAEHRRGEPMHLDDLGDGQVEEPVEEPVDEQFAERVEEQVVDQEVPMPEQDVQEQDVQEQDVQEQDVQEQDVQEPPLRDYNPMPEGEVPAPPMHGTRAVADEDHGKPAAEEELGPAILPRDDEEVETVEGAEESPPPPPRVDDDLNISLDDIPPPPPPPDEESYEGMFIQPEPEDQGEQTMEVVNMPAPPPPPPEQQGVAPPIANKGQSFAEQLRDVKLKHREQETPVQPGDDLASSITARRAAQETEFEVDEEDDEGGEPPNVQEPAGKAEQQAEVQKDAQPMGAPNVEGDGAAPPPPPPPLSSSSVPPPPPAPPASSPPPPAGTPKGQGDLAAQLAAEISNRKMTNKDAEKAPPPEEKKVENDPITQELSDALDRMRPVSNKDETIESEGNEDDWKTG